MKGVDEYLDVMVTSPFIRGIEKENIRTMLGCLSPIMKEYKKDEAIMRIGDHINYVCMVLEGQVSTQKIDYWGNRNIIANINPGQLFAESFACTPESVMMVDVVAERDSVIMMMDVKKVLSTCPSACSFHNRLIQNLLYAISSKNILLNEKLTHISQRSTREKLLSFLKSMEQQFETNEFDISFDRQQLADYLAVDRSAMSNELGKMRKEGLIEFKKNHFQILKDQE